MFVNLPGQFLGSPFVEFYLVDSPNSTLNILNSHKTFVKTKVVAHGILHGNTKKLLYYMSTNQREKGK